MAAMAQIEIDSRFDALFMRQKGAAFFIAYQMDILWRAGENHSDAMPQKPMGRMSRTTVGFAAIACDALAFLRW
jgi:hypothetical protein